MSLEDFGADARHAHAMTFAVLERRAERVDRMYAGGPEVIVP